MRCRGTSTSLPSKDSVGSSQTDSLRFRLRSPDSRSKAAISVGRKGDWIQIFLVMFFALLLVITLALLFVEKDTLEDKRPQLSEDLEQHKLDTMLTSLLRQPMDADVNGDGRMEEVTLATAVIANDGNTAKILSGIAEGMPDGVIYILESDSFIMSNLPDEAVRTKGRETGLTAEFNLFRVFQRDARTSVMQLRIGQKSAKVTLRAADANIFREYMSVEFGWHPDVQDAILEEIYSAAQEEEQRRIAEASQ